jgi:hypothetical protein
MNDRDREMFRRDAALQCLLVFLDNGGDKDAKVAASVEYADKLTAQLDETEPQEAVR